MKQAKIKCPHCGCGITVRQTDDDDVSLEDRARIWEAADEMFDAMDRGFKKIFRMPFWRAR